MTEKLEGTVMTLEEQIKYHLEYNLTVPVPQTHIDEAVKMCLIAIEHVNNHDLKYEIQLSDKIALRRDDGSLRHATYAWQVVKNLHLSQWLNKEWF